VADIEDNAAVHSQPFSPALSSASENDDSKILCNLALPPNQYDCPSESEKKTGKSIASVSYSKLGGCMKPSGSKTSTISFVTAGPKRGLESKFSKSLILKNAMIHKLTLPLLQFIVVGYSSQKWSPHFYGI
jgi:hypothetical protein